MDIDKAKSTNVVITKNIVCFSRFNITLQTRSHISALPLKHLDLTYCIKITDAGLAHLFKLPLQHLNVSCCNKITDAGPDHLSSLEHLQIYR